MNAMTTEEKVRGAITRHPDWDDRRIANSCTAAISLVRAVRAGEPISEKPAPQEPAGLISLDKVIRKYDIRAAIERELAAIPAGKLIEETELCRRAAGTDRNRFRKTIENNADAFRASRIKLKLDEGEAKWFWGGSQDIQAAQRIRDL